MIMNEEKPAWMLEHEEADNLHFAELRELLKNQPTREDLAKLATEESVRDVVHWQRNIVAGIAITEGLGKWGYRAAIAIATLLGAMAVITGAWKSILIWFIMK
jgi:hypothetical protein